MLEFLLLIFFFSKPNSDPNQYFHNRDLLSNKINNITHESLIKCQIIISESSTFSIPGLFTQFLNVLFFSEFS